MSDSSKHCFQGGLLTRRGEIRRPGGLAFSAYVRDGFEECGSAVLELRLQLVDQAGCFCGQVAFAARQPV